MEAYYSPKAPQSLEPSSKKLQKFCSRVTHQTGPVHPWTEKRDRSSGILIVTSKSGWYQTGLVHHWTATCLSSIEIDVSHQRSVGAEVRCTTGPSIVDGPVNYKNNYRDCGVHLYRQSDAPSRPKSKSGLFAYVVWCTTGSVR